MAVNPTAVQSTAYCKHNTEILVVRIPTKQKQSDHSSWSLNVKCERYPRTVVHWSYLKAKHQLIRRSPSYQTIIRISHKEDIQERQRGKQT